jgi:hypothetical protein
MIALDARGRAVLASRAERAVEDALRAAILGDVPSSVGDLALGRSWARCRVVMSAVATAGTDASAKVVALRARGAGGIFADDQKDAVDELWRAITALSPSQAVVIPLSVGSRERMARDAWQQCLCASIDAAARKAPITADELRERLFSRPLPRRRLRDGRLGPQAYAPPDPLQLP